MTRRLELSIAFAAIAAAVLMVAAALAWRFAFDSEPWELHRPPLPGTEGFEAFNLYFWIGPITAVTAVPLIVVTRLRGLRVAPVLAAVVSLQTAMLYLPFAESLTPRIDRLRGLVREPVPEARALVAAIVVTLMLAAVYAASTRARHALVVAAVLNAVLLHLVWLFMVLPYLGSWWPADPQRADLLVPLRPCRGAVVWRAEDGFVRGYGRIDDVWQQFDDPRTPGPPVRAVSMAGEWREEYVWLSDADLSALRVRSDDPAVMRCDSRARSGRISPEPWHRVGVRD